MPSLSSVLFSTSCKASLLFYSFMVTKFFPVHGGSHFIWILFWFAFSVSTGDPCTISDHAFVRVLLSIPALACSRNIPFMSQDTCRRNSYYDNHIFDFSGDSAAFKLQICYEPRPLGQKMFPKTWGFYHSTENCNCAQEIYSADFYVGRSPQVILVPVGRPFSIKNT